MYAQRKRSMTPAEKIWWLKLVAAIGQACLTLVLQQFLNTDGTTVFMFGALLYVMLTEILSRVYKMDNARVLKIGMGVFLFTWIMVWVLLNTVVQSMG